ncbi:MAG: LysR family transcriptional regulator [Ornithinimicrobium sp.]
MVTLVQLRILDALGRHGSVTAAAEELHYAQPTVSHHLARLEGEIGARLTQRVGRGIRLTEAGELLAARSAEIVGRVDSAGVELASLVGLQAGRVRLAGFGSAMASIIPRAVSNLKVAHPGLTTALVDAHADDALRQLRDGQVDVAVVFRTGAEEASDDIRLVHLIDDPLYLLTLSGGTTLRDHRDSPWIGGCDRCRLQQDRMCEQDGFTPRLLYTSDDMVVMQELVAAGLGVTTIPGLALRKHRHPDITTTRLPQSRRIYAATYGDPPDPPATAALLRSLQEAAAAIHAE